MSDIRVFVSFPDTPVVFSGETLSCKITFKNIASIPGSSHQSNSSDSAILHASNSSRTPTRALSPRSPPTIGTSRQLQIPEVSGGRSPRSPLPSPGRGHKPSYSLAGLPQVKSPREARNVNGGEIPKHRRSVSIVSIGSEAGDTTPNAATGEGWVNGPTSPRVGGWGRSGRGGHERSSSMQALPSRGTVSAPNSGELRMSWDWGSFRKSTDVDGAVRNGYSRPPSQPNTPNIETDGMGAFTFPPQRKATHPPNTSQTVRQKSNRSQSFSKSFKFPPEHAPISHPAPTPTSIPENSLTQNSQLSAGPQSDVPGLANGISKIDLQSEHGEPASPAITHQDFQSDTPRSSIEFYSLSNGTNETLLSEYDQRAIPSIRMGRSPHSRRHSLLSMSGRPTTESLMMGYAQVMGSFVVDGSLMQTAMFEEVKRKGIVSTHGGGGVVGLESSKTDSGFLGGFGWGLSSLLGGNNLSTIAEMKHTASMVGLRPEGNGKRKVANWS